MQNSTKVKLIIKKYLPDFLFSSIRYTYHNIIFPLTLIPFKVKVRNFKSAQFVNLKYDNVIFDLLIDPKNGLIDTSIYVNRKYETHILKAMRENINTGDMILDIGANIGHHTIYMSILTGGTGSVIAFEPIPKLAEQMNTSVSKNNITNIKVRQFALGNMHSRIPIYINSKNIGGSSLINNHNVNEQLTIDVITLDSLNLEKINFIEIDVEGYEWGVFSGGKNTIEKYKPKIIFEYSPEYFRKSGNENDGKSILEFLITNNYVLYDLENENKQIENIYDFIHEFDPGLRSQTNLLCLQK